jgi:hypothetical protein
LAVNLLGGGPFILDTHGKLSENHSSVVRECITGGREVRRRRDKLGNQLSSFIHKTSGNQNNKQMGTKPVTHQRKCAHALTINKSSQRHGENRG